MVASVKFESMPTNRLTKIQKILNIVSSLQISWECLKKCHKDRSSESGHFTLCALF